MYFKPVNSSAASSFLSSSAARTVKAAARFGCWDCRLSGVVVLNRAWFMWFHREEEEEERPVSTRAYREEPKTDFFFVERERERRHGVFRKKTRIKFSRHRSQKLRSSSANLAVCWTANETKPLKFARKKIFCRRFTRLTRERPIASCVNSPLSRVKIFPFSPQPLFRFSPTFSSPSSFIQQGRENLEKKKKNPRPGNRARDKRRERDLPMKPSRKWIK